MNRIKLTIKKLKGYKDDSYTLLDVGCRDKKLQESLPISVSYIGVDIHENEDVVSHDLENPLPFSDNSFDVVTALDVIEHLENSHQLLHELKRVSRDLIILSLPNIYHWGFRLRFLFGRDLGGKYKFPTEPIKDRHRWVTSFYSSVQFVQQNSGSMNLFVQPIVIERFGFRRVLQVFDLIGIHIAPNLFAYGVFFVLQQNDFR